MNGPNSILQTKGNWKIALVVAEQVVDDFQMSHSAGVPIDYEYMVELAVQYAKKDPVYAAALLMEVAKRCDLVIGDFPRG